MDKPSFVYVVYIVTTPEKLWNALIDGEMTRQYWGLTRNVSDWKPGSTWQHQDYDDSSAVKIVGKVLESDPPRRLVLTWAWPTDAADESKNSKVSFEIEPFMEDAVKLTVTHSDLEPDSKMLKGITQGWPGVLCSLKTLLETGKPMVTPRRWGR